MCATEAEVEVEVQADQCRKSTFPASKGDVSALRAARLSFRELRYHEVLAWAEENWRVVGETQKMRDEENSRVLMLAKMEREKVKDTIGKGVRR